MLKNEFIEAINKERKKLNRKIEFNNKKFENWGFPKKYLKWEWNNVDRAKEKLYDFIWKYIITFPNNLYIHTQEIGAGKTIIAILIVKVLYLLKKIKKANYINIQRFITNLKDGTNKVSDIMDNIEKSDLVVFDDIGKRPIQEWFSSCLYEVLTELDNREISIIVTSNYSLTELGKRMEGDIILKKSVVGKLDSMCKKINLVGYLNIAGTNKYGI